jgi:hypothetical protein
MNKRKKQKKDFWKEKKVQKSTQDGKCIDNVNTLGILGLYLLNYTTTKSIFQL